MTAPADSQRRARRTRAALLVAVAAVAAVLAGCSDDGDNPSVTGTAAPGAETTAPDTTAPDTTAPSFEVTGGDVYTPPNPLPGDEHGDLIWAEPVDQWWGSPRRAWRVLYRSESVEGDPIAVSGFVLAPPAEANGDAEPLPMVLWAHGTVGSADVCAPSRSFDAAQPTEVVSTTVSAQLTDLVDAGAVVVATDYEGLGTPGPHPFLVGESAGRGVLDAALATRQLPDVDLTDEAVIYGLSQGGHAALWAAELAPSWAPQLDVAGTVAAAPFSEVDLLLPAAGTIPGAEGYLVLGVYGQSAANSELDPADVLDPAAIAQAGIIEERCSPDVQAAYRQLVADSGRPIADVSALGEPAWREQIASIKPGTDRIESPVLVVQGERDTTIPAPTTRILVSRMCGTDTTVSALYVPDAGHADVVVAADAEIREWITARLADEPAESTCRGA